MAVADNETALVGGGGEVSVGFSLEQEKGPGCLSEESKAGVKKEGR